jgi:DNA-binding transcriptional ArsR family regulator
LRYVNGVRKECIHVELLRALAGDPERSSAPAPELAKALGTSPQFVVAKLRPLVSAGLVTRHLDGTGRVYAISDDGRDYLLRNG